MPVKPTPLRAVGNHPADGEPIQLFKGRYGPYVTHGGVIASLPRGADPETFALDAAIELLATKGKSKGKKAAAGRKPAAAAAKKPAAAKKAGATAKKTPAAKATAAKKKPPNAAKPAAAD